MIYKNRTLETFFKLADNQFPALLMTGARQVGKTTLLRYLSKKDRKYITLDNPLVLTLAREDPELFLQRYTGPILIDEIQYAPELLPYIKMAVDNNREPGKFWLTGSQQFQLMKGVSESLAGRIGIVQLLGLSMYEIMERSCKSTPFVPDSKKIQNRLSENNFLGLKELYEIIWRGSYPGIVFVKNMNRDLFYSSYVQTYIQRDVRDLAKVGDEMTFIRFLRAAAARTGQMLNISELAKDSDIAPNTAKNWLSILQTSGIIYLLEPYHSNLTKRLIKAPKLYFLDTGLCSYLTEWSTPETLEAGAMSGAILETWIIIELLKSYWHNGLKAPFYYYRDKDKKEIDLLIVRDGVIYPLEFKKSASPKKDDIKHFSALEKFNMPIGNGGIICLTNECIPLTKNFFSIPIGTL